MVCPNCGAENQEGSRYCKECRAPLEAGVPAPAPIEAKGERLARFLSITWKRKGPMLTALSIVLMMAMVFAPWAFLELNILGFSFVSRNFSGWDLFIPQVLFYLSIIPLLLSLMMIAGIGTKRRVVETHICTFFGGIIFTVWLIIFAFSVVLRVLLKKSHVIYVNPLGAQTATIIFFIIFMVGIIITTYDRGRELGEAGKGDFDGEPSCPGGSPPVEAGAPGGGPVGARPETAGAGEGAKDG